MNLLVRLEQLQRLADKVISEVKSTDCKLDDIDQHLESEIARMNKIQDKDFRANANDIERELMAVQEVIKAIFYDVDVLRESKNGQANELHKR